MCIGYFYGYNTVKKYCRLFDQTDIIELKEGLFENGKKPKHFNYCCKGIKRKKAKDIKVIDISKLTAIASYFVIASGTSALHVKSLADNVEEKLSETEFIRLKLKGIIVRDGYLWIIMI